MNITPHSFVYGRAVHGDEFLDRDAPLQTVFHRLATGQPTAVVGEPHIGKTSLLLRMCEPEMQRKHLGDAAENYIFHFMDMHDIPSGYTPVDFLDEALEPLGEVDDVHIRQAWAKSKKAGFDRRTVRRLFQAVSQSGMALVLLLDEFDTLVHHANFQGDPVFATIRSVQSTIGGLVPIIASRARVADLNDLGSPHGSPYFNQMIDLVLKPFDDETVRTLLAPFAEQADVQAFIRQMTGPHPYRLQAMAAAVQDYPEDILQAAETFYKRVDGHFHDVWRYLSESHRLTVMLLALMALDGSARGEAFNYGEIENPRRFERELRDLETLGLAERHRSGKSLLWDPRHLLIWRDGTSWRIGSLAFAWWLRDHVVAEKITLASVDEFLRQKRYRLFLTQEQWDILYQSARASKNTIRKLAEWLWNLILRRQKE